MFCIIFVELADSILKLYSITLRLTNTETSRFIEVQFRNKIFFKN